ncbi:ainc/iron permease, partial [Kipferlia bialata]
GWPLMRAALYNFLAALSFLVGELIAVAFSGTSVGEQVPPFSAGNFLYIALADLIPEMVMWRGKHGTLPSISYQALNVGCLLLGLVFLAWIKAMFEEWEW